MVPGHASEKNRNLHINVSHFSWFIRTEWAVLSAYVEVQEKESTKRLYLSISCAAVCPELNRAAETVTHIGFNLSFLHVWHVRRCWWKRCKQTCDLSFFVFLLDRQAQPISISVTAAAVTWGEAASAEECRANRTRDLIKNPFYCASMESLTADPLLKSRLKPFCCFCRFSNTWIMSLLESSRLRWW